MANRGAVSAWASLLDLCLNLPIISPLYLLEDGMVGDQLSLCGMDANDQHER